MYFLLSQVPVLQGLNHTKRREIVNQALAAMPPGKKIMLNIIKLLLITPLFLLIATLDSWMMLPWLLLAGTAYPLAVTPVCILFALPYLEQAIKKGS